MASTNKTALTTQPLPDRKAITGSVDHNSALAIIEFAQLYERYKRAGYAFMATLKQADPKSYQLDRRPD